MQQKFVSVSRGTMIGGLILYALFLTYVYYTSHSGGVSTAIEDNFYFLAYFVVVPLQLFFVLILAPVALFRFYSILVKLETNERWDLLIISLILVLAAFFVVTNLRYLLY